MNQENLDEVGVLEHVRTNKWRAPTEDDIKSINEEHHRCLTERSELSKTQQEKWEYFCTEEGSPDLEDALTEERSPDHAVAKVDGNAWSQLYAQQNTEFKDTTMKRATVGKQFAVVAETGRLSGRFVAERTEKGWTFHNENMTKVKQEMPHDELVKLMKNKLIMTGSQSDYADSIKRSREKFHRKLERDAKRLRMSPDRKEQTKQIVEHQQMLARKMISQVGGKSKGAELGDVVQIPTSWLDGTRVDQNYILGVVVEVSKRGNVRIATKAGVLKKMTSRSSVSVLPGLSNNRELAKLQDVFTGWKTMETKTIRELARRTTVGGGQGFSYCKCKKDCSKMNCSCRKEGRVCDKRCRCDKSICTNCEDK